jgi:hypothetical protein
MGAGPRTLCVYNILHNIIITNNNNNNNNIYGKDAGARVRRLRRARTRRLGVDRVIKVYG